jgi:hypothetical protein
VGLARAAATFRLSAIVLAALAAFGLFLMRSVDSKAGHEDRA